MGDSALEQESGEQPCSYCFGSGMEVVPGKGARRCRCRQRDASQILRLAEVPPKFLDCTLATYVPQPQNGSQLRAFNYAYRLVREYPATTRGLLLAGPYGVGKTHLAVAILRGLAEKGVHCLFRDFGSLLKEIQSTYNPQSQTSEIQLLAPLCNTEVLLLDELAATKPTEWARDVLGQIIGARYNFQKLTLVTTNYCDASTSWMKETLADRIGGRLRSRLHEMCKTVVVEGEDYRMRD